MNELWKQKCVYVGENGKRERERDVHLNMRGRERGVCKNVKENFVYNCLFTLAV